MASNQEATIPLKFWVDEEQNSIIVAEASGDFVDVLFSFLTLPLGTIIKLVSKNQPHQPLEIGCIDNLYQSVENFNPNVFWNRICQQMLLSPRNPSESACHRLKLKVDHTVPTKYFMCNYCSKGSKLLLSTFVDASCYCGKWMKKEIKLLEESKEEGSWGNGVFVKGDAMFLIFDDLRVLNSSPGNTVQQLLQLGYKDLNKLKEMPVNVGMKEIFSILKQALTSKSPLSDVFLPNRESKRTLTSFSPDTGPSHHRCSLKLKIIVSKSQNRILFAEAEGDFVDFLFSFLTIPLGSIINLMNGKLSLGSIDNLYTSVKDLKSSWFIGSAKNSLLNPRVPHQFGCTSQPIHVPEEDTPSFWYGTKAVNVNIKGEVISKNKDMLRDPVDMKIFEPRCSDGAREPAVGFMKRPCIFVVRDDLQVTPMTTNSSISFVQELHLPLDDFEEHSVEIKNSREALNLLTASLTSKDALTNSLFYVLKKRKMEICILGCIGWKEGKNEKKKDGKRKEK
ncbi:hypothetical protein PHAVU_008G111300 [Phaseolus vulgaris]|uniref:DUF674 family protein n=1 Tax=Phaseolus vulgaris TaxID=3885 RepID=V7B4B4_PHAVU|nr:hypothetical protein PHAVU_008G111300g [Phaseolus vulgaris]ESW12425.1 hypothetical protein PHAVU_008G111300g [Phaseolus vulgaris]